MRLAGIVAQKNSLTAMKQPKEGKTMYINEQSLLEPIQPNRAKKSPNERRRKQYKISRTYIQIDRCKIDRKQGLL